MFGDFNTFFQCWRTVYMELTIYDHFMNIHLTNTQKRLWARSFGINPEYEELE